MKTGSTKIKPYSNYNRISVIAMNHISAVNWLQTLTRQLYLFFLWSLLLTEGQRNERTWWDWDWEMMKVDVSHRSAWVWWSKQASRSETSLCWRRSCRDSACSSRTTDFFPPSLVWWRPSSGTWWSPPVSWLQPTNIETHSHEYGLHEILRNAFSDWQLSVSQHTLQACLNQMWMYGFFNVASFTQAVKPISDQFVWWFTCIAQKGFDQVTLRINEAL